MEGSFLYYDFSSFSIATLSSNLLTFLRYMLCLQWQFKKKVQTLNLSYLSPFSVLASPFWGVWKTKSCSKQKKLFSVPPWGGQETSLRSPKSENGVHFSIVLIGVLQTLFFFISLLISATFDLPSPLRWSWNKSHPP